MAQLLGDTGVEWSAESLRKAHDLLEKPDHVLQDDEHEDVWWVKGSLGYRVQTDGESWVSCTCPNGMRTARPSCYHTAAVLLFIRDRSDD